MSKSHVKTGDSVAVISGKWKGEEGKVLAVLKKKQRVVLEMRNLSPEKQQQIGRRTVKKTPDNPKGGLIERSVSLHMSNVSFKSREEKAPKKKEDKSGKENA